MKILVRTILVASILLSTQTARAQTNVVLVELFTSEGCSSCPPADDLLNTLSKQKNVITISEHVDYWNYLGWIDPYSDDQFSNRQRAYARRFGLASPYTPQAVVDGKYELNGASRRSLYSAISRARSNQKALLTIKAKVDSQKLSVEVSGSTETQNSSLYLVLCEDQLQSKVTSGENAGRYLKHNSVARRWFKRSLTGSPDSVSASFQLKLDPSWKKKNLKLVAFVQDDRTREVKALAAANL